jgi:type II secretion system (T2SS) protein E
MARCSDNDCRAWRPDILVRYTRSGLHVDGDWFCSSACVESATQRRLSNFRRLGTPVPAMPALRLGVFLLHQGAITSGDLSKALGSQRITGRLLGAELLHMGLADPVSILRGLAAQAGVNYLAAVDPACVRNAPGGLSPDEVRALGVVPIQVDETNHRLIVACRAPLPRAALSALRQLTGWTPEPLLVSDQDHQNLMHNYGIAVPASARRNEFVNVHGVGDAAARIAAAAASERTITLTEAHCDSATWVRIASDAGVNTLFMRHEEEHGEWQAATTLH